MERFDKILKSVSGYLSSFVKWVLISFLTGVCGGVVGAFFHKAVEASTAIRDRNEWLIFLLPAAGLLIVLLYRVLGLAEEIGTSDILKAVRKKGKGIPVLLAPAIFISTVITHLFGGSAGREGAALQLGGSIASLVAKVFKTNEKDFPLVLMCGMGAVPLAYNISSMPEIGLASCARVALLAALCAALSIVFCVAMHGSGQFFSRYIKNSYLRIFAGGAAVVILTLLCGTYDYNGAGMQVIDLAMHGRARPEAFVLKIIFTALTLGAGFRGGEIVPAFFIGSVFGCTAAPLLGLDASFGAAVGLVALFCGVVNCPAASIFLSIELFGAEGIIFFAIAAAVSYLLSGYYGLYSGQKIVYSKLHAEYIDIYAK